MLYLLSVILTASILLNPAPAMAGFFEKRDIPAQQSECSECQKQALGLNPDLMGRVTEIEKKVSGSLNKNTSGNEVTLFIDLNSSSFDQAVNALAKFKNDHSGWLVKGVIVGSRNNLKAKLLQKQKFFDSGIEFSIDLSGSLAKEFNILKTPVYFINYNGSQQRLSGLAEFNEFISRLEQ